MITILILVCLLATGVALAIGEPARRIIGIGVGVIALVALLAHSLT